MKVTKHLLEQFISLKGIIKEDILKELNKIGLEVESFIEYRVPDGVVVGRVESKEKHPDADKLSVCQVNIGDQTLQIVCGASNVQEGQFVAVATEGSKLQTPKGELLIQPTKLRGVESCGMLCSSLELGFPKLNDGILVLDESIGHLRLGESLHSYALFDNFVIELGLTPNRGDCFNVLGVARDLSVAFGLPLRMESYQDENTVLGIGRVLQIVNEGQFASSVLYKVADFRSLRVPLEVSLSLALCDLEIENHIQDFLTYAMHNVGVILRIYPFAYFQNAKLEENKGEILLRCEDGIDYVCGSHDRVAVGISPNYEILSLEGLFVLEASFILPQIASEIIYTHKQLSKDSKMTHKSTRGSNPDLLLGMQYLCDYLIKFTEVDVYSSHHIVSVEEPLRGIKITFEAINSMIGQEIEREIATNLLKKIGFKIEASFDETFFMAFPPLYRHDIQTIQDVTEEILRFYGIENIQSAPLVFQEHSLRENQTYFDFKAKRNLLKRAVALGFCETLHYVFVDRDKLLDLGFEVLKEHLDVLNPITNELNSLRTSLIPAMLESIQRNENLGFRAIAMCESGICYTSERDEIEKLAFAVNSLKEIEAFPHSKGVEWDFYSFADVVFRVIGDARLVEMEENALTSKLLHLYQSAWIVKNGQRIGYIGKLNPRSGFDGGFVCEVLLKPLYQDVQRKCQEFSKFQASVRDLTVMINSKISFDLVHQAIHQAKIENLVSFYPLDLYRHESFGESVALSIRFVLQSMHKTLQEEDLQQSMQSIINLLHQKFGATLRQ
ncbi:phenylalanine--tRNA ligase subunit beta [Helicobacter pametensis]|uniref:phenylalanine--tRNA ligase subunit beta n=1 Tax=Helicobacter pametensis TaxID=95149 RepID=UPI0004837877|nr:phenylalanine--tRNA ligase subunit beta [Helicobacter pametensis]